MRWCYWVVKDDDLIQWSRWDALSERKRMWVPQSHTRFSWIADHSDQALPIGHTNFSWFGTAQHVEVEQRMRGEGLRRGFLDGKHEETKVQDVEKFLTRDAPRLLEEAGRLSELRAEETSPYKHKYEARAILKKVHSQLAACDPAGSSEEIRMKMEEATARTELMLGINFYETEEVSQGHKFLTEAEARLSAISSKSAESRCHADYMDCLNHLAIISSMRDEQHKALELLLRAREVHRRARAPSSPSDLLSPMEKQLTTTCFLLAQVPADGD